MLAYQIMAGFSEIKFELRNKTNLSKSLDELRLWFSFEDNEFFAHDYDEHEKLITLAIYHGNENTWQITFQGGSYGKRLVENAVDIFERSELATSFSDLYRSHGYIGF